MNARPTPSEAQRLDTIEVEKVWGRDLLPHPFVAPKGKRIGEIWFDPVPACDELLVKYLFTSEKLSVQVHPSNENAVVGEDGKEECWLVIDAEPNAKLAIGFKQDYAAEDVAAAAFDGSIEDLLEWHDAREGDVFFLPAGTVHAIGPGLSLVEIQQNSDTTFRLYDYGRPRELHLERAMAVANFGPYSAKNRAKVTQSEQCLIDERHFRLDRVVGTPREGLRAEYSEGALVLPLQGQVSAVGSGATAVSGQCLYAPDIDAVDFGSAEVTLLTWSQ
ncbi:class I mannose-6-phosphate isomerase [Erythrobacter sp. YT30]|uniref:class I mannose-6-phosphate isomerase n=1 Tax=Erythrobacter sp. YT30 TaxID=1735012 RepID=UPI00076D0060|nr:class I mannose-6-phosphate isomerase [Erythrobacter sp. YT30]KWV91126.1 mannose-6-phosphate isomerase [Erythrobacter sp. YT30]